MTDVLIRNVDDDDLRHIDALAAELGLSRSELLRRETRELARRHALSTVTVDDIRSSAALARGALDEDLMRQAWGLRA
ncbi:MAG: ribbon-helix-helix protein, CopG family [Gordonia sp. (in: high G+C Gram-positive bacteria)]|uniref:type II toxin-antitoxin system VapB family antitoxin n=1 Tax=Gordonia sp. (in: high G+C Gram-positive bacteria) TaxID=84139 RepID=UPI0039E3C4EC